MKEQLQPDLEKRFTAARDGVVAVLNKMLKGRKNAGGLAVPVAISEDGFRSFWLSNKGTWGGRFGMTGYDLEENPPLLTLLDEYASMTDPVYYQMETDEFAQIQGKSKAEAIVIDETWEKKRQAYLAKHKTELLGKFIDNLEEVLQDLQNVQKNAGIS